MFKRAGLGARPIRRLRQLGTELAIVVVGVLLALWAQTWFEGRKEARIHRDTIAQMDRLFGRVLALTAARVSSSDCSRERIAELDEALRSSNGQWQALPLLNLPDALVNGHYGATYLVDSDFLPLQIFQTARDNGTMATLEPEDRHFYEQVERQLNWLHGVWERSSEFGMRLRVLSVDGPLSETARDEMRQNLAALDDENNVTILRARSLARLAQERGVELSPDDLTSYRRKIERDRSMFGDCVVELDPLELVPAADAVPASAGR